MKRSLYQAVPCGLLVGFALVASMLVRAGESPAFKLSEAESQILELTNQERKKKELPLLRHNPVLSQLARAHSANMAKQGKMDHILDGKTPFDRMRDAGYQFKRGGENIAAGEAKVALTDVIRTWMESKGHRENILGTDFTEIGVGVAKGKDGQIYYTQVFAAPSTKQ
jgi:uncharacterized protein YkwD